MNLLIMLNSIILNIPELTGHFNVISRTSKCFWRRAQDGKVLAQKAHIKGGEVNLWSEWTWNANANKLRQTFWHNIQVADLENKMHNCHNLLAY